MVLSSSLLALAENACTHDRSRRSQEMQKDRRSFLSSESLITALCVPLRAVGVTAPSCLHASCCSFVVDTRVLHRSHLFRDALPECYRSSWFHSEPPAFSSRWHSLVP